MIAVKITLEVLPEKKLEVMQTLTSLIKPVGKEQGCKSYYIACDINDKNCFCIFEEWKTREDLDHHIKSLRFGVLLGTKTLLRNPLKIRIYSVIRTQGMEAVEAIRAKRAL
ncbi:putative quinol monooxygenase [Desulfobacula phenolica]|uniref:Quinol monooxygenase YgiN n=1 Tax=Desulfobacula phenolica TaxID=90732 RepID=A0A1H2IFN3_9BACT|nr:putative quinol monooxygenase [Desulfobacula phenolica]SDU42904.1 Quinol monooxygenase YgiN [Desulfobacula phenolica]